MFYLENNCWIVQPNGPITVPLSLEQQQGYPRNESFQTICQRTQFITSIDD